MSARRVWLRPEVPEADVVALAAGAGWVLQLDSPRTRYDSRRLVFTHPESGAELVFAAFCLSGCQTVALSGEPDAPAEELWQRIEALPRYEQHVADAGATGEPRRLMQGLRQWVLNDLLTETKSDALPGALSAAAHHAEIVVRLCALDLSYLAAVQHKGAVSDLARRRAAEDEPLAEAWATLVEHLST
jgi:hypothetical protein